MEKMKKKRVRRYISWALLAALVAGLTAMPLLAAKEEETTGPQASILSASVRTGNIDVTIRGGGTLSGGESQAVTLPAGVKITEFLVDNGDLITEGTPVARVDRVSVMNVILEISDSMETIREQLAEAADDTIDSAIRAAAGGRVKQVYASPGDSVADVMLRHGALAVLSLDSMMAVALQKDLALGAGDSVRVLRETGEEITGRVESNLEGSLVVTVEDRGYAVGEQVTVNTEDGSLIGSGALYIHNAWKAVGYSGTVQSVYIREDQTVADGAALFSLTDRAFTGSRDALAASYQEYAQLLQKLFEIYDAEVITAPRDGVVSGVAEDSPFLLSASGEKSGWNIQPLAAAGQNGWQVILLSGSSDMSCTGTDTTGESCQAQTHISGCYYCCNGKATCTAGSGDHLPTCVSLCISADKEGKCLALNHKANCIEKCEQETVLGACPSTVHKTGCIESCIPTDGTADCPATVHRPECLEACDKTETCPATGGHYPQCLTWCTEDKDCTALYHKENCYMAGLTYEAHAALVLQVGITDLVVLEDTATRYQVRTGSKGWELIDPATIREDLMLAQQTVPIADPANFEAGDIILIWTGFSGDEEVKSGVSVYSHTSSSGGMSPGYSGGSFGGFGSFGSFGGFGVTPGTGEEELFDLTEQTLLTVTDHTGMVLTVTLDEQDIGKIYLGQPATVRINALKGESFEAQITKIGNEGSNNGGSSKFTAELTLPWREDLIAGMHATATIIEYTKAEVLTVPVAALYEQPGATVVYTALDPETGEPSGPQVVTTGVSDGESVEILTGLTPGSIVYYSYYNAPEPDHTAKADSPFG